MLWRIGLTLFLLTAVAYSSEPIWDELGLQANDTIDKGDYKLITWRFKDSTSALAAVGQVTELSKKTPVQVGNYLLTCEGKCPKDLTADAQGLPKRTNAPLPVLRTYLPDKHQVAHSARYVIGPVGLSQATLQIPAAAAAFRFGTEAALARYRIGKNEAILAMFDYPTPQIARQQVADFQKIPGAVAKRSGPIIGVVLNAADEKVADTLLQDMQYQASISWDQVPPLVIRPQTAAQIVVGGIELSGIIMVFCLLSGLAFGGFQFLRRRFGHETAGEPMIVLHLSDK